MDLVDRHLRDTYFFYVHVAFVLEHPWTFEGLPLAIKRVKLKRSPEETGLTAVLLKAAPEEFFGPDTCSFQCYFGARARS